MCFESLNDCHLHSSSGSQSMQNPESRRTLVLMYRENQESPHRFTSHRESSVYILADFIWPQVHWITKIQSLTTGFYAEFMAQTLWFHPQDSLGKKWPFERRSAVFTRVKPVGGLCAAHTGKWAEMSDWSVTEVGGAHISLSKVSYTQENRSSISLLFLHPLIRFLDTIIWFGTE